MKALEVGGRLGELPKNGAAAPLSAYSVGAANAVRFATASALGAQAVQVRNAQLALAQAEVHRNVLAELADDKLSLRYHVGFRRKSARRSRQGSENRLSPKVGQEVEVLVVVIASAR